MSRLISFAVLIAIIIIIGLLFYKVLIGFFIPVFLAAVLVVVFRPAHRWVLAKTGHRDQVAAALTTLLILVVLFLPIVVIGTAAATQGLSLITENDSSTLKLRIERIRDSLGLQLPPYQQTIRDIEAEIGLIIENADDSLDEETNPKLVKIGDRTKTLLESLETAVHVNDGPKWDEEFAELIELADSTGEPSEIAFAPSKGAIELKSRFSQLKTGLLGGGLMALAKEKANPTKEDVNEMTASLVDYARPRLLSLTGATGSLLIKLAFGSVILIVATFFFLYDGPSMVKTIMYLSPLDDAYEQELLLEFDRISRAVVLATLLSAIVQGITAGIGYAVAGMDYLTLLIMLTTVFAMVPFVGPAVVWVPVCLYLALYEDRTTAAIVLALWGVLVVGTVDNLVKAFVLHGQSQLHPLLALLSVLGGVQALGPIGIVVGPMVVAMLQTLLGILQRELLHFEKHDILVSPGAPGGKTKSSRRKSNMRSRTNSDSITSKETDDEETDDEAADNQPNDSEAPQAETSATDATPNASNKS